VGFAYAFFVFDEGRDLERVVGEYAQAAPRRGAVDPVEERAVPAKAALEIRDAAL
jgi:hypothetical protein